MTRRIKITLIILSLLIVVILLAACGKKAEKVQAVSNLEKTEQAETESDIGKEAICPVRKEKFTITAKSPMVEYKGKKYYFCCPGCDKEFMKDPEKYLKDMDLDTLPKLQKSETNNEINYWTCSMHPTVNSDKPGDCPICAMDLIPIYKGDEGRIIVDEPLKTALKIKSQPVVKKELIKEIHVPGRVANDEELYLAQQEYLSVYRLEGEVAKSAKLRLKLFGITDSEIERLARNGIADESLIYPSIKRTWLFAEIYETDAELVKPGQEVSINFSSNSAKNFIGRILSIEPQVNNQTRSAKARIIIDQPNQELRLDMYADMKIGIPLGSQLCIPTSALINTGTRKIVYVEMDNNRFEPRRVETGYETKENVQIIAGLNEGARVVTEGNFLLDSQSTLAGGQALLYGGAEEIK